MLHVSQRAHYGLRAMTELAKAYGNGCLSLVEIAEVEHLSAGYLEQLAMPLRRAGLIEGTRGPHGGYSLSKPPAELTVGEVIRALEGPVAPVECLTDEYVQGSCIREPGCGSRVVWRRVQQSIDQVLDSLTLADLCATAARGEVAFIPIGDIKPIGELGRNSGTVRCAVTR
ncbi:MAG: transcriptional regulator, BadM/Rrf2 family [Chloroflexi bacterium]|nr:transcriptional regulator, BadM/Rrf2 family [Chloroflexota bacterium]